MAWTFVGGGVRCGVGVRPACRSWIGWVSVDVTREGVSRGTVSVAADEACVAVGGLVLAAAGVRVGGVVAAP